MSFEMLMVDAQIQDRLRPLQRPAANRRGDQPHRRGHSTLDYLSPADLGGADLGGAVEGGADRLAGLGELLADLFD